VGYGRPGVTVTRHSWTLLVALSSALSALSASSGCRREAPEPGDTSPTETPSPTPTPTPAPTSTPPTPPTSTTPTTLPQPCEVDPALTLLPEASQPHHANELTVAVTVSDAASVAVACQLRDDPAEVHLAEGVAPAEAHELRLAGLLADQTYDCVAAAVCPATAEPVAFEVRTGPDRDDLPGIRTQGGPDAGTEYVLLNASPDCGGQGQLIVVDRDGRIRWWYEPPLGVGQSLEFRYHGGDRFVWGGGWGPNELGRPRVLDLYEGEVYDSGGDIPNVSQSDFHHDGKELPDGRMLTLEEVDVDNFRGFRVRRITSGSGVDFDYHSQRARDEGHLPGGFGDAWHANWADVVDEVLYVSLCNLGRVVAVDVATGDWLWTFGVGGDFDLVDTAGQPLGDDEYTQCQHGLEYRASDDHLLVYDNGWDRGYSRVTEYEIDQAAGEATLLWTWTEPDWFETTLGDADWLASGNVLIGAGHAECFSSNRGDHTTVLEVDPVSGDKVWELQYTEIDRMAYRADSADACSLFANARYCDEVGERLDVLAALFGR
jgi:hypothetical protein